MARQLEVRGAQHVDVARQLDVPEIVVVAARAGDLLRLVERAAAEVDLQAGAGEHDGDGGPPRAGADDGGAAQRRQPAEPLPLEHHVRPDPVRDGGGELRRGALDLRERQRPADADAHLVRADPPALADRLRADHGDGDDGRAALEREAADAALGAPERAGPDARALREHQDRVAAREDRARGIEHVRVALAAAHGERAERVEEPRSDPAAEQLLLGHVVHGPARDRRDHERVEERAVVRREDDRAALRHVLAADPREPEVEVEERLEDRADEPVDERVHAALAVARVKVAVVCGGVRHRSSVLLGRRTRLRCGRYSARMAFDSTRTLRGALAGATAAAVWAAQQPLDKRVFGVDYDDVELLAGLVRARGPAAAARRPGSAPGQRRAVRRDLRERRAEPARPAPAARRRRRPRGAPRHLAGDDGHRPAGPRRPRLPAAVGQPARVRPGRLAPPAVRRGARRARAAAQPAGGRARAGRRRGGRLERARLRGAPGRQPVREGPHHRRHRLRRAPSRRRLRGGGRRGRARLARDRRGPDRRRGRTRRRRRRAAGRRLPPRRARTRGRLLEGAGGVPARQRRAGAQRAGGGARRGAGGRRGDGRLGRGLRPAGAAAGHGGRAAAAAEPVRGLQGVGGPARGLLRRRARAARDPRPRVQPRGPGPGARLRDRLVLPPGRGRRDAHRHRQPGHAARLHRRPRRRPRLPAARGARRAGDLQRLLGPHGLGRGAGRHARRGAGGRPGARARARGHGGPRLTRARAGGDGMGAGDPARAHAGRHRRLVARDGSRGSRSSSGRRCRTGRTASPAGASASAPAASRPRRRPGSGRG